MITHLNPFNRQEKWSADVCTCSYDPALPTHCLIAVGYTDVFAFFLFSNWWISRERESVKVKWIGYMRFLLVIMDPENNVCFREKWSWWKTKFMTFSRHAIGIYFCTVENSSWSWANGYKGRLLSGWHLKNERGVFVHLPSRSNFFFGQTCSCHDAPHVGCHGWQTDVRTWASRFSGPSRWWDREVWVLKSSLTSRCMHFGGQIMMLSNLSGF